MDADRHPARRAGTRFGGRLATAVFTLACLSAGLVQAQAPNPDTAETGTAGASTPEPAAAESDGPLGAARPGLVWRWEARPRAPFHARPFDPASAARGAAPTIDYRLWFGDQRTEVGLGYAPREFGRADASASMNVAPREAAGMVLAFRHQVSAQSRLTFDTRWSGSGDAQASPTRRMAFDLGLESSPLQGLAKGTLLRAQLNAHSNLALRFRGGRLGLYLGVRITGAE